MMIRFRRMQAALEGRTPDQVPASAWFHFGSEHLPPAAVARLHAEYQAAYGWDFLKVNFDYRLAYADGVDANDSFDLRLMLESTDWSAPFTRQRDVLEILHAELGSTVPIVETVYSPWMYLVRHTGHDLIDHITRQPDLLHAVLARLAGETCRHVRAVRELGGYGIYLATLAAGTQNAALAPWHLYDRDVLDAASGMVRMLHLHGNELDPVLVAGCPRDVLHWHDRSPTNPSLSQMRGEPCLMGGLDQVKLTTTSMSAFRREARNAIVESDGRGFILAPGCSVSPSIAKRKLLALRDPALLTP
jgi:uroporphyrinogen decarboxylase